MTLPADDDWTEATDADIPRVDLVGKAANGVPGFLLVKSDQSGLFDAGFVRDLIKDADPAPAQRDDITMTGSPAAMAKMIHQAARRAVEPTPDAQEGTMTAPVAKADDEETPVAELDVSEVLAEPADTAPGNDTDPGSPAWEAVDSATAQKWTAIAVRLKNAIQTLAGREGQEVAAGDDDDQGNVWDLQDAACAVDYAISVLAPYAVGEQAEVDFAADDAMQAVGKSMHSFDAAPLEVLEGFAPVIKAGRVLSAANEAAIRSAIESLTNVVNTLPAPIPDAAPVAKSKELEVTAPVVDNAAVAAAASGLDLTDAPVVKAEPVTGPKRLPTPAETRTAALGDPVAKAKGDPMTPVYDENGKLVGMIDATDLIPIATAAPAADPADPADPAPVEDPAPAAPAADPAAAPAPAVDANGLLQKALADNPDLLKSIMDEHLKAAVAPLEERIAKMESQPMPGPMLNGATPGAAGPVLRGHTGGTDPIGDLRKAYEDETNQARKDTLRMQLVSAMVQTAPPLN